MLVLQIYVDASAIISLFINDVHTEAAEAAVLVAYDYLSDSNWTMKHLIVSDWAILEVSNVVMKLTRSRLISPREASILLHRFDKWCLEATLMVSVQSVDIAVANIMVRNTEINLRSPDAVHIAMAQRLNARLLTFDKGMSKAAAQLGLALAC